MQAKLRVLTATVVLTLLAGLSMGAGQPGWSGKVAPKPAPAAPVPVSVILDLSGSKVSTVDMDVHWVHDLREVTLKAAADVAQAADIQLQNVQMLDTFRAARESKAALLQAAADMETSAARGMKISGRQSIGFSPAPTSGYSGKGKYVGDGSNGGDSRSYADPTEARRAASARYQAAAYEAAVIEANHATYAADIAKKAMDKQLMDKQFKVKNTESPPAAPNSPAVAPPPPPAVDGFPGDDAPRPVVNRYGKPAPGLPEWFIRLDTDHDGQVGLYEWRVSGRSLAEFAAIDRNDDGLITAEEMLWYLAHQSPSRSAGPTVAVASAP
jgi:hypothetical protein